MPYNPDSDDALPHADSHTSGSLGGRRSRSFEPEDVNTCVEHGLQGQSVSGDELGGDYSGEDHPEIADTMDVDLVRGPSGTPGPGPDSGLRSDPQPSLPPVATAAAVPSPRLKVAKVAVVLHSSPQKGEYETIPDHLMDEDHDPSVTSYIMPSPRKASDRPPLKDIPAPAGSTGEVGPQSVPFPISTITPQPKKRGRPLGWRPGSGPYSKSKPTPGDRSRGRPGRPLSKTPKTPKPPGEAKRRGRPPKKPPLTLHEIYLNSNPKFPVFLCEWEGCPAQLHNLETLRRHLVIVHGKTGTCKWGSCPAKHPKPLTFPTRADFEAHLDKTHILACAWHLGNGPRNHSDNPPPPDPPGTLPDYLFDKDGKQVTPWVADLEIEDDDARKKRKLRLARLLMQRDNNAPPEPTYTTQDWADIAAALNAKRKRQRMFRDYHTAVCGTEAHPPKYGPEWKGLLVKEGLGED